MRYPLLMVTSLIVLSACKSVTPDLANQLQPNITPLGIDCDDCINGRDLLISANQIVRQHSSLTDDAIDTYDANGSHTFTLENVQLQDVQNQLSGDAFLSGNQVIYLKGDQQFQINIPAAIIPPEQLYHSRVADIEVDNGKIYAAIKAGDSGNGIVEGRYGKIYLVVANNNGNAQLIKSFFDYKVRPPTSSFVYYGRLIFGYDSINVNRVSLDVTDNNILFGVSSISVVRLGNQGNRLNGSFLQVFDKQSLKEQRLYYSDQAALSGSPSFKSYKNVVNFGEFYRVGDFVVSGNSVINWRDGSSLNFTQADNFVGLTEKCALYAFEQDSGHKQLYCDAINLSI
ncbi:hypothetical protein [Neptunicella marina]|uniref:Uncharacterized protein n=1 Tax=Neptunicella marina TaxID=2125989 RepID=A0A8J6M353_9ALTE|nr:hypothetical protein [Neptunicella marina]MBC3766717.1 hypothetical protein [Neptunicella marina]